MFLYNVFVRTSFLLSVSPTTVDPFKTVYAIPGKFGLGFEYYSDLGSFSHFNSFKQQEHLLGPVFDLYSSPNWELQTGILFGLTPGSNQQVFKLIAGRRFKKKG